MDGFNTAMFDQFNASNAAGVANVSLPWLQKPPVQLPWVLPANQYPDIVRFSAQQPVMPDGYSVGNFPYQPCSPPHNAKRKSDSMEEIPCPKKLITEEKISGLLKEMHITASSPNVVPQRESTDEADMSVECPKQQLKRLVLCEEIRKFKSEPILPSSLLSKLSSPSTSLVLWKPPPGPYTVIPAGQLADMALRNAMKELNTSMDTETEEEEGTASVTQMQ